MNGNKEAPTSAATLNEAMERAALAGASCSYIQSNTAPRFRQDVGDILHNLEWPRVYAELDRRGNANCIFHADTHPSMSFRNGRFRCWACGAHGDVVDYVMRLYGLDFMGALRRISEDFHLDLILDRPPSAAEQAQAQRQRELSDEYGRFETWRENFIVDLCRVHRQGHLALQAGDELADADIEAVKRMAQAEYYAEQLSFGEPAAQMQIFRDRREISRWIERALNGMPMKSKTA